MKVSGDGFLVGNNIRSSQVEEKEASEDIEYASEPQASIAAESFWESGAGCAQGRQIVRH